MHPRTSSASRAQSAGCARLAALLADSTRRQSACAAERSVAEALLLPELVACDQEVTKARAVGGVGEYGSASLTIADTSDAERTMRG